LAAPDNAYVLLTDEHTQGRFACALAVAKLERPEDQSGEPAAVVLVQPIEQALWTEPLRGLDGIREVMFLSPRSVRAEGQGANQICAAANRLGATLLLLYAPNVLGENSAEVLGALYETRTARPLATLRASSTILDAEGRQVSPDRKPGDHRADDARYQAQRKFEREVLACLRALMQRDAHPTTTQPSKWKRPSNERWWIPRSWMERTW
jgi:hypothetical protein